MTTKMSGFYGTDSETYYHLAGLGRTWIVSSEDDLGTDDPVAIADLPEAATWVGDMLTPEEAIGHLRRIERAFGETLVDPATLVGVDREAAERYFAEGGTVYVQPKGYSLFLNFRINRNSCRSFKRGMAEYAAEGRGNPEYLIDPDHPHPANPVERSPANPNSFAIA